MTWDPRIWTRKENENGETKILIGDIMYVREVQYGLPSFLAEEGGYMCSVMLCVGVCIIGYVY